MEKESYIGKLGIYARQSVEKETTGSIDDQILSGKEKAKELGMNSDTYIDRGESAAYDTLDNRPEFVRLSRDIIEGKITSVFVYDESRLSRNKKTFNDIVELFIKFKIVIHTKIEGVIDYRNPDQEFISGMKNLFNVKYVRDTSKKIKNVLRNNAMMGKVGGGVTLPFGYKKNENKFLVPDAEEAAIYFQMVNWSLSGYGVAKIASLLNEMGVHTKGRKLYKNGLKVKNRYTNEVNIIEQHQILWAPNTILSILKNPIYKGERHFKGEIFKAPPLIDYQQWTEIQNGLQKNRLHSSRNNKKHVYLLKGLLRCSCGRNLYGYIKEGPKKTQNVYQCSSKRIKGQFCGMKSVNIKKLDSLIWELISDSNFFIKKIVAGFQNNDTIVQVRNIENQKEQIKKTILLLEEKRQRRLDLYESGGIERYEFDKREKEQSESKADWNRQLNELIEKTKFLSNSRFQQEKLIEFAQKVCDNVNKLTKEDRIGLLRKIIKNIIVNYDPANKRHIIQSQLNFDTIVNTPVELFLKPDGTSNYVSPKYNLNTFNDEFNQRNHILLEKYKPGKDRNIQELVGNQSLHKNFFIATNQHHLLCDEDF